MLEQFTITQCLASVGAPVEGSYAYSKRHCKDLRGSS